MVGKNLTLVNSGTISGGNGGAGGAGASVHRGSVGSGGAGVTGQDLTLINSGTISGGLSGDGKTRASAIVFTGGANVLELWAGSRIAGAVVGTGKDTFRLGGQANAVFDVSALGVQYQGFNAFQKVGSSAWTLTGATDATTPWAVNAGALIVNGSIARARLTTINSGATLMGQGAVGNVLVNGGGVFAPGAVGGAGVMTVAGDLTFKPGSTYIAQIGATGAARANVSGVAWLDGTLIAAFAPGAVLTRSYDVLHAAGGFNSTRFTRFKSLQVPTNFSGALRYGATDVTLDLTAALGAGVPLAGNEQRVATALNGYFNAGGPLSGHFSSLYGLTGNSLAGALTAVSGEAATGAQQTAFRATEQFLAAMLDPTAAGRAEDGAAPAPALAFAPQRPPLPDTVAQAYASVLKAPAPVIAGPRWTSWASGFGGANRLGGDRLGTGSHDLSGGSFGVAGGLDYHLTADTLVGGALAGGGTQWGLAQGLGGGASDVLHAGLYGATRMGPAYLSGAFDFANHWMTTARLAAFGDALAGRFAAQTYGGRVEGGWRLATPLGGLTPYAAAQTQSFMTPGYAETGALIGGFGLAYQGRAAWDTRTELGAKLDRLVALHPDLALALRGRLAWAHDWVSDPTLVAQFQTLPAGFLVAGATPVANTALVSGGAELCFADGAVVGARFDGGFAPRGQSYAGTVNLKYSW